MDNQTINGIDNNLEHQIKLHPFYTYITAVIFGFTSAFGMLLFLKGFFNLEIEKKGTYIYYQDYYRELQTNYIQKEYYNNLLAENNSLKELLDKYRAKNTDIILSQINELKNERDKVTEEVTNFTTSMKFSPNGAKSINTETEKYKNLKIQLQQINDSLSELYKKL
ncbi:MAG TPA: hypothetical protein DDW50_06850 [Firmicutes bacterium]|nr:hypothetical protein [Bacillota bacterium]